MGGGTRDGGLTPPPGPDDRGVAASRSPVENAIEQPWGRIGGLLKGCKAWAVLGPQGGLRMRHAPLAQAAGSDVGTCSSLGRLGERAGEIGLQIGPLQLL